MNITNENHLFDVFQIKEHVSESETYYDLVYAGQVPDCKCTTDTDIVVPVGLIPDPEGAVSMLRHMDARTFNMAIAYLFPLPVLGFTTLYYVSVIVQYGETSKPCLCAKSNGYFKLDSAKEEVEWMLANYRVWAIWIDEHDSQTGKKLGLVYHECYLDVFGDIDNNFLGGTKNDCTCKEA